MVIVLDKLKLIIKNKYFKYITWLVLIFISYYSIDVITRFGMVNIDNYFKTFNIYSNLFSIAWIFLFLIIYILCNNKLSKKIFIFSIIALNIYSLALLTHLNLLGRTFNIYDFFSIGEGFNYLNGILSHINILSILIIINSVLFTYLTLILWPKNKTYNHNTYILIGCLLLSFISLRTYNIINLKNTIEEDTYDSNKDAKKTYQRFNNPTSAIELSGIYEFIYRDIKLFMKDKEILTKEEINDITNYLDNRNLNKINEYTGLFKDKNIIMLMLESVDNIFVNNDIMPNLTSLKEHSLNFTNRYTPIYGVGATFNTEYTSLTGLYSPINSKAAYYFNKNDYKYSLPNMFKNNGYKVNSFHMNDATFYERGIMHQAIGFTKYNSFMNYTNGKKLYADSEILDYDNIVNDIIDKDNKFFSYVLTYSPHLPYTEDNYVCKNYMQDKFYDESDYETSCVKSAIYNTDVFIGKLVDKLKDNDLLDDTVIVIYNDHLIYGYSKRVEKGGTNNYDLNTGLYMIYNSNLSKEYVDTINTTIDMAPTILNLFDIDNYNPSNYLGVDVFNESTKHIAYFSDYNWLDNNGYSPYLKFNYVNKYYYDEINTYVENQIKYNNLIINGNYYKYR